MMVECEKEKGFMNSLKAGLSYISEILSSSIFPSIADGAEMVMRNIEDKIMQIEKRIVRKVYPLLIIGFGSIFLIFALFFFLIEHLSWTKTTSFFSIGITIFVIGLLLKLSEPER